MIGQKLEIVTCSRRALSLSRAGCVRLWLSAQEQHPAAWEGRVHCVACPDGATRAGRAVGSAEAAAAALEHICPRCLRVAPRLINGWLCISCYNRHREAMVGRNAKGIRPRLCSVLHADRVVAADAGGVREVQSVAVANRWESLVLAAKAAKSTQAFGVPPARWPEAA